MPESATAYDRTALIALFGFHTLHGHCDLVLVISQSKVFTNHLQPQRLPPRSRASTTGREGCVAHFGNSQYILTCWQAQQSVPSTDDRLLLIILMKSVNHHASQILVLFRTQAKFVALNAQVAASNHTEPSKRLRVSFRLCKVRRAISTYFGPQKAAMQPTPNTKLASARARVAA